MPLSRRLLPGAAASLLAAPVPIGAARAQTGRPVTVIIPFAGGSASDVVGRIVLERMGEALGTRFVVDNRPGASGNLGTVAAARAEPDGQTLLITASGPLAVNRFLFTEDGFDPLTALEPVSMVATLPNMIVVHPSLPARNLAEFIALLRARPEAINYGSIGNGSSQHLAAALFEQQLGVRMTHVPYRVTGQLVTDLVAGRIEASFQLIPNVIQQVQSSQLRALALTAAQRSAALPEVRTVVEEGVNGYEAYGWFALLAPRGTPQPVIARLNAAYREAMADPATRARVVAVGAEPAASSPAELRQFMEAETRKWGDLIRMKGIRGD